LFENIERFVFIELSILLLIEVFIKGTVIAILVDQVDIVLGLDHFYELDDIDVVETF